MKSLLYLVFAQLICFGIMLVNPNVKPEVGGAAIGIVVFWAIGKFIDATVEFNKKA